MRDNDDRRSCGFLVKILTLIGAVTVIAGIAYAVYRYFTPDYLEDLEDDFDDYFEDDDEYEDEPLEGFEEEK
ncbi:MAG: hypothetical protein MR372_07065 [Lachnospiraceae bacterium]|nr:hypothetical protein [Lachnospiraceae bacterium]MDY6221936.1 hypothetical protein [Candidatus Alectryocaccobium sp.]